MLILTCPTCGKVREARDVLRSRPSDIGSLVHEAATKELQIGLGSGQVELGCECEEVEPSQAKFQINLKQILLLITTLAMLLAIFRHPISLLFSDTVRKWAMVPWSLYGWLFFGMEVTNPKTLQKDLMGIFAMLINIVFAVLLPLLALQGAKELFVWLWKRSATATSIIPTADEHES